MNINSVSESNTDKIQPPANKDRTKTLLGVILGAALLAVTPAQAGPREVFINELEGYANIEANLGDYTASDYLGREQKSYGKGCDELVTKAKKTMKPDEEIESWSFDTHPKARKTDDGKHAVKVSELSWFCDRYRNRLDELSLRFALDSAVGAENMLKTGFDEEGKKTIRSGGQSSRKEAAECLIIAERMLKSGTDAKFEIKTQYSSATLSEMPKKCEQIAKYADLRDAEWKVQAKKFEKPFTDEGISGDRLDWFVYYGPGTEVWLLKGCKSGTLKELKKADALFHWTTSSDGIISVSRFQFKGDKLTSQTSKEYLTEAAAYKGCK